MIKITFTKVKQVKFSNNINKKQQKKFKKKKIQFKYKKIK